MGNLQEQLAKIEQDLSAEKQKGPEGDQTIIARLESEQAHILEQIMLAEQQEREQKQLVTIGAATSIDILSQMFDALLPDSKYKPVLGINEYESKSQDFKQMIQAYISETVAKVYEENDQEIVQKDEKIRLLMGQGQLIQVQLDEANREKAEFVSNYERDRDIFAKKESALAQDLAEVVKQATDHSLELVSVKRELEIVRSDRDSSAKLWTEAQAKIAELESKIEAAQKPKEESKPSESLQNMLSTIKSKNELNADDMVARWNSRQKSDEAKIQVPDLPSAVLPFQGEDGSNPAADVGNTQLPSAQVDETVGPQFPSAPNVETAHAPELGNQAQPTGVGMAEHSNDGKALAEQGVSREEHEALKSRVEALESRVA